LVYRTATQNLTQNVSNISNFNQESFDSDGFHDNSTNNSRITIPSGKGGKYLLIAGDLDIENSGSGSFTFMKNGGVATPTGQYTFNDAQNTANSTVRLVGSFIVSAVAGDYFEVSLITNGTGKVSNRAIFGCTYLGA